MATNYPSLLEIGIKNPEEIIRYSLQSKNDIDSLRIVYKRKQGSLLPSSKKFIFNRIKRMVSAESDSDKTKIIYQINPILDKVISELDQVVNHQHTHEEQKEIIQDEINRLDQEVTSRIAYIKTLVDKLN